jgi:hypothetical protein
MTGTTYSASPKRPRENADVPRRPPLDALSASAVQAAASERDASAATDRATSTSSRTPNPLPPFAA